MSSFFKNRRNFAVYAWIVLAYLILVILWGAFVRATGSGAGCGSHWPLCNGVVVPREPAIETIIELTHRVTSAFSGVMVLGMLAWSFYAFPRRHRVRRGAVLTTVFIIIEGLLGAGLVLFELVADNASMARAGAMAAHLVNTFVLLAVATMTAWWASGGMPVRLRQQGRAGWLILGGALLMLVLGASGAVTALGDTLFPASSLREGLAQDFSPTVHFLVRLRIWHPVIAIITGVYLVVASNIITSERPTPLTVRFSRALLLIFTVQFAAGVINVLLLAPVWMQILHLLLADLLWIMAILFAASALAVEQPEELGEPTLQPVAQVGD